MRWHAQAPGRFTGEIAAVPVTLLSRDEDAHAHSRQGRHHGATTTAPRRTFPTKTTPPHVSAPPAKLPDHRTSLLASTTETIRLSATVVVTPRRLSESNPPGSARVLTPRSEEAHVLASALVADAPANKFLVCAGRAMNAESPRSNNDDEHGGSVLACTPTAPPCSTNTSTTPTLSMTSIPSAQANESPRGLTQRALQRSDSELELIISELREKIAVHQRSQSPQIDDERSHQHARKHLKNPVEKMSLASSASSTSVLLRRQASASQVHATRLVREGSATMVTPVVLASSASRAALAATHGSGGVSNQALAQSVSDPKESHPADSQRQASVEPAEGFRIQASVEPAEGFRIRAYLAGSDTLPNPVFTSSTSLGQGLPTSRPSPPRATATSAANPETAPVHASLLRPPKPRARTLVDLDLELDRLYGFDGDGGPFSPVGPWAMDQDVSGPLASSRSTASLGTDGSVSELALASPESAVELSPRSRLLWLSDCCSDDAWATPSVRVMAMLRPGSHEEQRGLPRRPASAAELRRRQSKSRSAGTPGKGRATSAKVTMPQRTSGDSSSGAQNTVATRQPVVKAPLRLAQRPRSGSGSSSTGTGSWSSTTASVLAHRTSFRA